MYMFQGVMPVKRFDFCKDCYMVFNISKDYQTEKNRRENRSYFAFSKFFVCNFIHEAL